MVGAANMTSHTRLSDSIGSRESNTTSRTRLTRSALLALVCLPALAWSAWPQSTTFRVEDIRAALEESNRSAALRDSDANDPVAALANYIPGLPEGHPVVRGANAGDGGHQPLLDYVDQLESGQAKPLSAASPHRDAGTRDSVVSDLMEFAREVAPGTPSIQLA